VKLRNSQEKGNGSGKEKPKEPEYPQAVRDVYQAYAENIVTVPAKKADALRNIAARLRDGYTPEQLIGTVERYFEEREGNRKSKSDVLPFHANNFFGQKAYFLGYLPEVEPATKESANG
jgi:hypothetical protein